jgi:hypothetical protein
VGIGGASGRCLAAAIAALLVATEARAEGLSLYLEPTFTLSHVETSDQLGNSTERDVRALTQNYRLNFDRSISPAFTVSAGALYEARRFWSTDSTGSSTLDAAVRGVFARLTLGLPVLSGGLTYDFNNRVETTSVQVVSQNFSAFGSWLPVELPEFNLRLGWNHQYDTARVNQDVTTLSALGSVRYLLNPFEFRYLIQWAQPKDAITGTEASALNQTLQGVYSARLFEGRSAVYVSLTLRNQMLKTLAAGSGTVSLQQHPVAGLSLIEANANLPTNDTLLPNPALIDGDTTVSANVDLVYAPGQGGEPASRDLGVQFADLVTPVNTVQVWVDRLLPPEIAVQYVWTAYRSDDNKTWTPIAITGTPIFGPFQNRFEIPIAETQARYVKVVTQPLSRATFDPTLGNAYANVFVTEVQVFLVRSADAVPREQSISGAVVNATASTLLWRAANLNWDVTAIAERRTSPGVTTWSFINTLTAAQWLSRTFQVNERLARQDGNEGLGHYGQTDWSLGVLWRPLPTFLGTLTYTGQFVDARPRLDVASGQYVNEPAGFTHSIASLARADLYEGISALVNASWSLQNEYSGTNHWDGNVNASTILTPNQWVSFTLGWVSTLSLLQVPEEPVVSSTTARIDASLTLRPTAALSAVATVSRILAGQVLSTYGTVQLNYWPLRGDLQFYVTYSKTFDTAAQSTIELFSPGVRWNVRPGIQLNASYSLLNNSAPVGRQNARSLSLGLNILL